MWLLVRTKTWDKITKEICISSSSNSPKEVEKIHQEAPQVLQNKIKENCTKKLWCIRRKQKKWSLVLMNWSTVNFFHRGSAAFNKLIKYKIVGVTLSACYDIRKASTSVEGYPINLHIAILDTHWAGGGFFNLT